MIHDLPPHLLRKIASQLNPTDAVILSTCHSGLRQCGDISRAYIRPHSAEMITSFCQWLYKHPGCLTYLGLYDTHSFGADEMWDTLYTALEYAGTALETLVIGSRVQPVDLVARLPSLQHVVSYDGRYPQLSSLAHNTALKTLHIKSGLDYVYENKADFLGIASAPSLEKLVVWEQPEHVCLCMISRLQSLKHLEIIGTPYQTCIAAKFIRHLKSLPHLHHLILDSSTPIFDGELYSSFRNLKTFDVSRRHPEHIWVWTDEHFTASHNDAFLRGIRAMRRLDTLGCRDTFLNDSFFSTTVKKLLVTNESLGRSFEAGFHLGNVPSLKHLIIDGACCTVFPELFIRAMISQLEHTRGLTITLHRPVTGDRPLRENAILSFWMSMASACPHVYFRVE